MFVLEAERYRTHEQASQAYLRLFKYRGERGRDMRLFVGTALPSRKPTSLFMLISMSPVPFPLSTVHFSQAGRAGEELSGAREEAAAARVEADGLREQAGGLEAKMKALGEELEGVRGALRAAHGASELELGKLR